MPATVGTRESTPGQRPVRVFHFVTGGFSGGATQVAIQLVNAARESAAIEPLLVLRRKRHADPARIAELRAAGVPLELVAGWSHAATIAALVAVCRRWQRTVSNGRCCGRSCWPRWQCCSCSSQCAAGVRCCRT